MARGTAAHRVRRHLGIAQRRHEDGLQAALVQAAAQQGGQRRGRGGETLVKAPQQARQLQRKVGTDRLFERLCAAGIEDLHSSDRKSGELFLPRAHAGQLCCLRGGALPEAMRLAREVCSPICFHFYLPPTQDLVGVFQEKHPRNQGKKFFDLT
jgi:hypothetical protein